MDNKIVVQEVPDDLRKLVKMIIRGFHTNKEDSIVMDYLLRNTIMNETQLSELLKLDKKLLRSILNRLKCEHFLKTRLRIESDKDGKSIKQMYYYIDYKSFVNVVKYKLHQMQKKIESQERNDSCKASYICSNQSCSRSYNELDIDKLMDFSSIDPESGEPKMICTFCGRLVVERVVETEDSRHLLIKFNQQMEPIYDILRDIENYKLSNEILEPSIGGAQNDADTNGDTGKRLGGAEVEKPVTIDFASQSAQLDLPKEIPSWMKDSTVKKQALPKKLPNSSQKLSADKSDNLEEEKIKKTIMFHESKTLSSVMLLDKKSSTPSQSVQNSDEDSDASEGFGQVGLASGGTSETQLMSEDESESDGEEQPRVPVGNSLIPFDEINEQHIAQMTSQEKEIFAKIGQKQMSSFDF